MRKTIQERKAAAGEVVFATIHRRQGPAWLAAGTTDVAVVWSTEARHHTERSAPFETVTIPAADNRVGSYAAAVATGAAHGRQAGWFLDHLCSQTGHAAYTAHGFAGPHLIRAGGDTTPPPPRDPPGRTRPQLRPGGPVTDRPWE